MFIQKGYIYRYKEETNTPLCIYLCDTQTQNRILVVPLTSISAGNVFKLSVTNQYADLQNHKEIYKDAIFSPLYLNSHPVRIPDADLRTIQQAILDNIMERICSDIHTNTTSQILFESIYQFLRWKWQKLLLNVTEYQKKTTIYENGIYWASLGVNVGSELNKSRPVLVWKKRCSGHNESNYSYIVIPITSKEKSKKYYMNVPININSKNCFLRIEDMRRINIKRFTRPILDNNNKIIFINQDKRHEIMKAIEQFYIFENQHTEA